MRLFFIGICCLICVSVFAQNHSADLSSALQTDKALYKPGEPVLFSLRGSSIPSMRVRYRHLDKIMDDQPVSDMKWTWNPPKQDFSGYLAELYQKKERMKLYSLPLESMYPATGVILSGMGFFPNME